MQGSAPAEETTLQALVSGPLPVTIGVANSDDALLLGSRSATAALTVLCTEEQDFLYAGNVAMGDLLCLPVSLEVEFAVDGPYRRRRRTAGPGAVAGGGGVASGADSIYAALPVYESLVESHGTRGVGGSTMGRSRSTAPGTDNRDLLRREMEEAEKIYLEILPVRAFPGDFAPWPQCRFHPHAHSDHLSLQEISQLPSSPTPPPLPPLALAALAVRG